MRKKIDLRQCDQCRRVVEQTGQTFGPGPWAAWLTISRNPGPHPGGLWDFCSTTCAVEFLGHLDGPVTQAPLPDTSPADHPPAAGDMIEAQEPPPQADQEVEQPAATQPLPQPQPDPPADQVNAKAPSSRLSSSPLTERRQRPRPNSRPVYEWPWQDGWHTAQELADLAGVSYQTMRYRLRRHPVAQVMAMPVPTKKSPPGRPKTQPQPDGQEAPAAKTVLASERAEKCHRGYEACAKYGQCWLRDDLLDRNEVACSGPALHGGGPICSAPMSWP